MKGQTMTTTTTMTIDEAMATMTRREMAIAMTIHEAERKGIEMSSREIARKAARWIEFYDRYAGFGRKRGLAEAYLREMAH